MLGEASDVLGWQGRGQLQELVSEEQRRHRGVQPARERPGASHPRRRMSPGRTLPEGSPGRGAPRTPGQLQTCRPRDRSGHVRPHSPGVTGVVGTVPSAVLPGCAHVAADRLRGAACPGPWPQQARRGLPSPRSRGPELVSGRATRPGAAPARPQSPCSCPARAALGPLR